MSSFMQWVTHGVKRGRFEMGARVALYSAVSVVALTLVAAVYLMLVSRTAAQGRHIEQLQTKLFRLQRENQRMEAEIAEAGSVSALMERAAELGFAPAEEVEFLVPGDE